MFEFHKDKERYFKMTTRVTEEHVIPFLQESMDLDKPMHVLEIGSGEAGVLKAFVELGHQCTGIELSPGRVKIAEALMEDAIKAGKIRFIARDIYDIDPDELPHKFDLIVLKDVIEHIHDQDRVMGRLKEFLAPEGKIFFGFPPWQMPFGGHQQICRNKWASRLPYYHLLPVPLYRGMLKMFGESENTIKDLLEIKETGISIERFQRISRKNGYKAIKTTWYLFNPVYQYKFGLKPRKQLGLMTMIPWVRNFFTTCVYTLITQR